MADRSLAFSADVGPMARFEDCKADPSFPNEVFRRVAEGDELPKIALELRLPKAAFSQWFSTKHADLYDAARKVREADLAMELLEAARGATPEDVQVQKLKIDTLKWLMSKWDRARYGESVKVERDFSMPDATQLLGAMSELLRLAVNGKSAALPEPRVIEHSPIERSQELI